MKTMKRLLLLLCSSSALLCAAELSGVRLVYVMPMSRGLDQYLANRLTNRHVFQVVTDPKLADAVFTDRLGEGFQQQLGEMIPPPPAEKKEADADTEEEAEDKPEAAVDEPEKSSLITDTANKLSAPGLNSSFGRAKGTIFLVDLKSRAVLWSTYNLPKNAKAKELNRNASGIVSRLMGDLKKKK